MSPNEDRLIHPSGAKQVAEKLIKRGSTWKKHPSGAEAPTHFARFIGPAKAVPLLQNSRGASFSATCEAPLNLMALLARPKPCPDTWPRGHPRVGESAGWTRFARGSELACADAHVGGVGLVVSQVRRKNPPRRTPNLIRQPQGRVQSARGRGGVRLVVSRVRRDGIKMQVLRLRSLRRPPLRRGTRLYDDVLWLWDNRRTFDPNLASRETKPDGSNRRTSFLPAKI